MLFLMLVIGVGLPGLSRTKSDGTLNIGGRDYTGDCSLRRVNLADAGCPRNCAGYVDMCAIRGVPYANASRFERPQPINSTVRAQLEWQNERVHCAQIDAFSGGVVGVEDCLVVDFYFPRTWTTVPEESRKLVVLLEGLNFESSLAGYLQPTQGLGDDTYMLAVVHYRTGVFGFMTLHDDFAPPNLGLWDQQMALQFLHNETSSLQLKSGNEFIVLGFGSGATALHMHMLSPKSSKTFSRALLSGGNALSPGAMSPNALNTTLTLARRVRCERDSNEATVRCLREKSIDELLAQVRLQPALQFAAVVEPSTGDRDDHDSRKSRGGRDSRARRDAFFAAPIDELVRRYDVDKMQVVVHGYPAFAGLNHFLQNKGRASTDGDIGYLSRFFGMYGETTAESVAKLAFNQFVQKSGVEAAVNADPTSFVDLLTDFLVGGPVQTLLLNQLRQRTESSTVRLDFYVMYPTGSADESSVSLASYLNDVKGELANLPQALTRHGSALDDMLLFVGCKGVAFTEKNADKHRISANANRQGKMANELLKCLLMPEDCNPVEEAADGEGGFSGQKSATGSITISSPYRFAQSRLWASASSLASAMSDVELQKWALQVANADLKSVNTAGAPFWGMLAGLIVLAVIAVVLSVLVAKLVAERRRAISPTTVEKPARSEAHFNAGMESVTVEEANRM